MGGRGDPLTGSSLVNVLAAALKAVPFYVPSRSFFRSLRCCSSEGNNQPRNVLKTGAYLQQPHGLAAQHYLTIPLPNARQGPYSLKPTFQPPRRPASGEPELHRNANVLRNDWDGTAASPRANLNIYTAMGAVSEDEAPAGFFPVFSNVARLFERFWQLFVSIHAKTRNHSMTTISVTKRWSPAVSATEVLTYFTFRVTHCGETRCLFNPPFI